MLRILLALMLTILLMSPTYAEPGSIAAIGLAASAATNMTRAGSRPPSAIELAAETAAEMTFARRYPEGEGVYACGTVLEASLYEDDELFATVVRDLGGRGHHALVLVDPDLAPSARGPEWARERARYAVVVYEEVLKEHGF
jgi:hypothetical protein